MRVMVLLGIVLSTAFVAGAAEDVSTPPDAPPKEIVLFNGKDLDGLTIQPETPDAMLAWKVKDGVLHATGVPTNYIRTKEKYSQYLLRFEWRWLEEPGNSGLLLHIQGEAKVWPRCLEAQLKHEDAGDFFIMEGVTFAELPEGKRRTIKREPSNEKPLGEWNEMTVEVNKGNVRVSVNGVLQNEASEVSVEEGYIGFQSEGTPIEFRNIAMTVHKEEDGE